MKILKTLIVLTALIATAVPAHAQDEDTTAKVDEIMAKMIDALGGKEAHLKIKNRVSTGKMVMAAMGMEATMRTVEALPAKRYMVIEMPAMGMTQEQGSDGEFAWAKDTMTGSRLLEDKELKETLAEGRLNAVLEWKKIYPKRSYGGEMDFKGKKCHKLLLEFATGSKATWYVDAETNLQYGYARVASSPMGEVNTVMVFKDHKKVDGLMIPHRMEINQMGQDIVMEITSVKHNVELAEDAFAFPDDVKKLVEKKKAAAEKPEKAEAGKEG